jgi:hypothetical protein
MWIIAEQSITYYVQGFCNCSCSSSCSWTAASTTGGSSASSTSGRARCFAREGQIHKYKYANTNSRPPAVPPAASAPAMVEPMWHQSSLKQATAVAIMQLLEEVRGVVVVVMAMMVVVMVIMANLWS